MKKKLCLKDVLSVLVGLDQVSVFTCVPRGNYGAAEIEVLFEGSVDELRNTAWIVRDVLYITNSSCGGNLDVCVE